MAKIHQPCPDCGSSDALQINNNGSTFCHSCRKYTPSSQVREETWEIAVPVSTEPKAKPDFSAVERTLTTGNYQAIVDRGLTTATAKTAASKAASKTTASSETTTATAKTTTFVIPISAHLT